MRTIVNTTKKWQILLISVLVALLVVTGICAAAITEANAAGAVTSDCIKIEQGASIRLYGTHGIRFTASIDETQVANAVEYGILLSDKNSVGDGELTVDNAKRVINNVKGMATVTNNGRVEFKMVLVNIYDNNFSRTYVARAYVKDGAGNLYYTNAVERSPYAVATAYYEKNEGALPEAQTNVLDKYMVLDVKVDENGVVTTARDYTDIYGNKITVSGSIDDLAFNGNCKSLIVNGVRVGESGSNIPVGTQTIIGATLGENKVTVTTGTHEHTYVWDKSHSEYDIKACSCGKVLESSKLNKIIDTTSLTIDLSDTTKTSIYVGFNGDVIKAQTGVSALYAKDMDYHIGSFNFATAAHIGNVSLTSDNITALRALKELHGYTYVDIQIVDDEGEKHTVKYPVLIITANVSTYAEWVANIYPVNGDTYGCYGLKAQINFAGNAELSAPKGAFKGTLIGNNNQLIGSQGYGRHIFGKLDGATIENVRIQENGYRGSYTRNGLAIGLLGCEMKNSTLNKVTFTLQNSDWPTAIDISAGTGWLVSGAVYGNTMTDITVAINKQVNALAPLFGSQYSDNTITGFTWSPTATLPAGDIIIGKNADTAVYLCDVTGSGHSAGATASYDDNGHWYTCTVCGSKTGYAAHSGVTDNGTTHITNCSCGYTSSASDHTYTWDKSAADKDIGTCYCGATIEFDKELEGILRLFDMTATGYFGQNILFNTDSVTKLYSKDLVDTTKSVIYTLGGTVIYTGTGSFTINTNEFVIAHPELHGYQNITAIVTDIYGVTHEILVPVRIITAHISDYAGWVANVYPANGDTYGCYNITAGINFAGNSELSAPQGAFKGTIIGNNIELIGSQGYGRHIFGKLDGATIEDIRIRENGYRGSYTRNNLPIGLLGCEMKNCTLNKVTFTLQGSDWASAIDVSTGTGWLVGGEVSGNTMTAVSVVINKTVNALAPIFGSNFSNNTFEGFTWTVNDGITLPAGNVIIGKSAEGEITGLCDLTNNGVHTAGTDYSHDAEGHWHSCTVCGAKADYDLHIAPADLADGTHKLDCTCGYSTEAEAHAYVWNKSAEDRDVGTCICGNQIIFDKLVEGITAKELDLRDSSSNWAAFGLTADEINSKISAYTTRNGIYLGGVKLSGDFSGVTYTAVEEMRELHGLQDVIVKVIDSTGEEHDVKLPVILITATVSSTDDWMNYIFPQNGDTYGYFKMGTAGINLSALSAYTAAGAFKGTFVGNGAYIVAGSQQYNRNIFGNLDGATIKDCRLQDYKIWGPRTDGRALLGGYMKNTTLHNVTIWVSGSENSTAISAEMGSGWLVSGEVSNNIIDGITIDLRTSLNAFPTLFGDKCSDDNMFGSVVLTTTNSTTLPTDVAPIAKTASGELIPLAVLGTASGTIDSYALVLAVGPDGKASNRMSAMANDLQTVIKAITGVHLPALLETNTDSINLYSKHIVLGDCNAVNATFIDGLITAAQNIAGSSFTKNPYVISSSGNDIFLCGTNDMGTMNAVYKFLEIYFDYEGYSVDYVSYAEGDASSLNFDMSKASAYSNGADAIYLANSYRGLISHSRQMYRMNFNGDYAVDFLMSIVEGVHDSKTHNATDWIPYSNSTKNYYRQEKGFLGIMSTKEDDLCYTAHGNDTNYQAMLSYCLEVARTVVGYAENADKVILPFSKEDVTKHCECKGCQAVADANGGNYSATVVKFMNDLIAKIEADATFPRQDFKLMFFAYEDFEIAPTNMTLDDRVVVMIPAAYSFNYQQNINHSSNDAGRVNLQNWANISTSGDLFIWTYSTKFSNYLLPVDTFNFYNEDAYAFFKSCGVTLLTNQGQSNQTGNATAWHKLKMYLDGALPNESTLTQAELITKYMTATFGPAAEAMTSFFNSQCSYIRSNTALQNWYAELEYPNTILGAYNVALASLWSQTEINNWLGYCSTAYAAIDSALSAGTITQEEYDRIKKNIDAEWVSPAYMSLMLYGDSSVKSTLITVITDLGIEWHSEFNKVGGQGSAIDIITHINNL